MPNDDALPILPGDIPVVMPDVPPRLIVRTEEQVKAAFDPLRGRVLQVLRERPATTKQLAQQFKVAPSLMTYHLRVLEESGLVQVVAQRLVHGIVAKYYARTAQIFVFRPPQDATGVPPVQLQLMDQARDELLEALPQLGPSDLLSAWAPHVRLPRTRMQHYVDRLAMLVEELLSESADADGQVFTLFAAAFLAPRSLQAATDAASPDLPEEA